jgi:hypothetical protein
MRLLLLALFLVASFMGSGCSSTGDPSQPVLAAGTVARIEISPRGALLVPSANNETFSAKAFDANGQEIAAAFTWTSNAPEVIALEPAGASARATARIATGSALVTAEAGGVKTVVFAVAAEPLPGTVLLRDDQISALPKAIDPAAPFGPGFRYRVDLVSAVNAPVGAIALSTGTKTVAGRIVASDGSSITVEQLTLDEVLPRLDIRQRLDLTTVSSGDPSLGPKARAAGLRPLAEKEFKVGPLECKVEGSVGALELAKQDVALGPLSDLTYDVAWTDTQKKIVVTGKPVVNFELVVKATGQLEGKVDCKARLRDYTIPLPGPLGIFLGAAVPLGLGFEASAKAVITDVGVSFKGSVSANVSIGFDCQGNVCTGVTDAQADGNVTPRFIPPQLDLLDTRVEPEAQVYAWAKLEGGARFESTLRFEAIEAQAGFKVEGSLAGENAQAKADDYVSSYKAGFALAAGPSGAADTFLRLVKVAVNLLQFAKEIPLGASPAGTSLVASQDTFKTGENVKFALKLDPAKVKFPVVGYNVEAVRIYRKQAGSLVLANEVLPQGEQVDFEIPWVATVDGAVGTDFVAFVKTRLIDLRLEVGNTKAATGPGELILPNGEKLVVDDSVSSIDNDFGSAGDVVVISEFYYSSVPDGVAVCTKKEQKANTKYVRITIYDLVSTGIVAGARPYKFDVNGFSASHQVLGAAPSCSSTAGSFIQTGAMTITGAGPLGYSGTLTLTDEMGMKSTGTFNNVPSCRKTQAEAGAPFTCVP